MKKKLSLAVALFFIVSMVLTACGNSASKSNQQNSTGATAASTAASATTAQATQKEVGSEKFNLRIAWWGSQTRHDSTLKAIDMFKVKYPNATIDTEYAGWDGYWDKITVEAAANQMPDVFQQDYAYLSQYAAKDILEDLTPYAGAGKNILDLSSVDTKHLQGGEIGGKIYGISLGTNAFTIIYDPEMFKKAGVQEPSVDWTWSDFEKYCAQLHEKLGIYATSQIPKFEIYLRQFGKSMYSTDGTTLGYDDDKLFVDYYSMYLRIIKSGGLPSPAAALEVKSTEDDYLVRSQSAMTNAWSNIMVAMSGAAKRPLSLALLPNGDSGTKQGLYLKPSMFFSITKSSKQKDEAAAFLNFFINDIEANKVLNAERGVPINSKVRDGMKDGLDAANQQIFEYIGKVEKYSSPIDPPDPPGAAEVYQMLTTIEEEIAYEKVTPEEAAAKYRKSANDVLSKNKE